MTIPTGKLNRRVRILEPRAGKDADGVVVQGWIDHGAFWANIQHRPGSEAFQQARMEAKDPATVAVRVSTLTRRINSQWRIETEDSSYEIKGNPHRSQDNALVMFQVEGKRK